MPLTIGPPHVTDPPHVIDPPRVTHPPNFTPDPPHVTDHGSTAYHRCSWLRCLKQERHELSDKVRQWDGGLKVYTLNSIHLFMPLMGHTDTICNTNCAQRNITLKWKYDITYPDFTLWSILCVDSKSILKKLMPH
ncbi:hypothetical protein ScPMuIL_005870 [Solemya velum]